jgi:membrane protein implicated in regulation of membrane protease activity
MSFAGLVWSAGAIWLATALVLVIAELAAPGFFLIFLAAAAALTGLVMLVMPGMSLIAQALLFAATTAVAVRIGRRWYHRSPPTSTDPLLNDRAARLIGKTVEVCDAIVAGEGRVRVGDGAWTAQGPDTTAGAFVRITGAKGSVLLVETVDDPMPKPATAWRQ